MEGLYHSTAEIFRRTDGMLRRCIEKKLRTLDEEVYRSQHRLLMMLGKNPNCSQNELAIILDVSPAAVAVSLGKLEKNGYITRETSTDDRRSNHVSISEKGNRVIQSSIKLFDEVERTMFQDFDEEEIGRFQEFLRRAYRNLESMQQADGADISEQTGGWAEISAAPVRREESE